MVDPNNRSADSSRLRNRGLSFDEEYVISEEKRYQKKSFEYISQALEIDENSTGMYHQMYKMVVKNWKGT